MTATETDETILCRRRCYTGWCNRGWPWTETRRDPSVPPGLSPCPGRQHMTHVLSTCETQFVSKIKKKRVNSGALVNMSVPFISLRYHLLPAVLVPTKSQEYILAKYVSGKTTDVLKLYDSPGSVFHFMLWQRCDYGLVRVRHKYHLELWKCDVLA